VVDDDPQISDLLRDALTGEGHECTCAPNGNLAFKAIQESPFDLVVMDLIMPEAEGIETIMKIRKDGHHTPILAISGGIPMVPTNFLLAAGRLGADRTLAKPFELAEFMRVVEELLGKSAQ
jgi:DNA-binding response OmpR family regulator